MSQQLTRNIARYRQRLLDAPQYAVATLATVVHDETPHDTYAAQNGWRMSINGTLVTTNSGDFLAGARRYKAGDTVTMLNSVPYIRRLEYGWSQQQPAGFLRRNAARWDDIVAQGVRAAG